MDDEALRNDLAGRLAAVPGRIARATADQPEAALRQDAGSEQWSVAAVFAHMRASDDIIAYRIYAMLARDNPPLPAYDDRRWAEVARYAALPFRDSLAVFALRRAELVTMLQAIPLADWQRTGQHEVHGTLTIWDVVHVLVEHEEEHCTQLETLV